MSMYPIASQTIGSGGASSITFSSIPQNFTHLQLRGSFVGSGIILAVCNGDFGANYSEHVVFGYNGNGASQATVSQNYMRLFGYHTGSSATYPTSVIMDIYDYTSTNKNKTFKVLFGTDQNGDGEVGLSSGLWFASPTAITSISLVSTFNQYSTFQLYGMTTQNGTTE